MPVVESVSYVVYFQDYNSTGKGYAAGKVLEDLGVSRPILTWHIIRNTLLHTDEVINFIDEKQEKHVGWEISFGGFHATRKSRVHIDVGKLYYDLLEYIEKSISNIQDYEVVLKATRFTEKYLNKVPQLKAEIDEILSQIE